MLLGFSGKRCVLDNLCCSGVLFSPRDIKSAMGKSSESISWRMVSGILLTCLMTQFEFIQVSAFHHSALGLRGAQRFLSASQTFKKVSGCQLSGTIDNRMLMKSVSSEPFRRASLEAFSEKNIFSRKVPTQSVRSRSESENGDFIGVFVKFAVTLSCVFGIFIESGLAQEYNPVDRFPLVDQGKVNQRLNCGAHKILLKTCYRFDGNSCVLYITCDR